MKIEINKIKITVRIRKEIGKIEELAANIREHGLIAPIAVMPLDDGEFQLLAGLRRIRAMELNGETEIDAKVFPASDAEAALRIEYSENEQREPFTYSEKMDYAKLIEEIEKARAKERMSEGGKGGILEGVDDRPHLKSGKSRDNIGSKIGMSGRQYERAKYIAENAPSEIIDELDRGERTINGAYEELRAKKKVEELPIPNIFLPEESITKDKPRTEIQSETQTENHTPEFPMRSSSRTKTDPLLEKFKAMEAESIRKHNEFEALSPNDKITELQKQLKEQRTRAADAEYKLSREIELRKNAENHLGATIEMLNNRLALANARISELEEKYESNKYTS